VEWTDVINVKWFYFKVKWSEWSDWSEVSYGEGLVDKGATYIRVTLYCGHLIILWLFHLGISCTVLVLICTVTEVFLTLTEVFPCFFLSCKANARVKLVKTGHGPHSSTLVVICVVRLLFVLFYVLFGARGGAVGWGTALQAVMSRVWFPMVSLKFFIDIILPAALWPWSWLSL